MKNGSETEPVKCLCQMPSYADQILIERYMNLNASARESIIDFLIDVVSKLNNDDSIFDGVPSTPEELEKMYPPVEEDKREGGLG